MEPYAWLVKKRTPTRLQSLAMVFSSDILCLNLKRWLGFGSFRALWDLF